MSTTQRVMCECPPHKKESVLTFGKQQITATNDFESDKALTSFFRWRRHKRSCRFVHCTGVAHAHSHKGAKTRWKIERHEWHEWRSFGSRHKRASTGLSLLQLYVWHEHWRVRARSRLIVIRRCMQAGADISRIIAIMLGRLRMDIDECIRVYRNLGTKIFAKKQPLYFLGQNKYDYKKLQKFVRDTAREQSRSPAERDNPDGLWLYDPGVVNAGELTERDRRRNRFVPCRV